MLKPLSVSTRTRDNMCDFQAQLPLNSATNCIGTSRWKSEKRNENSELVRCWCSFRLINTLTALNITYLIGSIISTVRGIPLSYITPTWSTFLTRWLAFKKILREVCKSLIGCDFLSQNIDSRICDQVATCITLCCCVKSAKWTTRLLLPPFDTVGGWSS